MAPVDGLNVGGGVEQIAVGALVEHRSRAKLRGERPERRDIGGEAAQQQCAVLTEQRLDRGRIDGQRAGLGGGGQDGMGLAGGGEKDVHGVGFSEAGRDGP